MRLRRSSSLDERHDFFVLFVRQISFASFNTHYLEFILPDKAEVDH